MLGLEPNIEKGLDIDFGPELTPEPTPELTPKARAKKIIAKLKKLGIRLPKALETLEDLETLHMLLVIVAIVLILAGDKKLLPLIMELLNIVEEMMGIADSGLNSGDGNNGDDDPTLTSADLPNNGWEHELKGLNWDDSDDGDDVKDKIWARIQYLVENPIMHSVMPGAMRRMFRDAALLRNAELIQMILESNIGLYRWGVEKEIDEIGRLIKQLTGCKTLHEMIYNW